MPAPFVVAGLGFVLTLIYSVFKSFLDWTIKLVTRRGIGLAFFFVSATTVFLVAYNLIDSVVSSVSSAQPVWSNYLTSVIPSNFSLVISGFISIEMTCFVFKWSMKVIDVKTSAMVR